MYLYRNNFKMRLFLIIVYHSNSMPERRLPKTRTLGVGNRNITRGMMCPIKYCI